ncbi:MAG: hypothetical protein IPM61_01195 [Chlorobi bacterium]|nr:hypothetical protein [Chlorobiota bacterium]
MADSIIGQPYPWVQYLLGGSKEQLAVWHGQQMTSPFCDTAWRRNVFLYPTEYLSYGVGKHSNVVTRPDGAKEYRFFDHLGSSRAVLGSNGFTYSDYAPFGGLLAGGTESRKGFIGKEKDGESDLRNLGVRQYDDEGGRFLSVDRFWELYRSSSPYNYGLNNPIGLLDPSGDTVVYVSGEVEEVVNPAAEDLARVEERMGMEGEYSNEQTANAVMTDSRVMTIGFGDTKMEGRIMAAIVRTTTDADGNIIGLQLIINKEEWDKKSHVDKVTLLGHEFKHGKDLFSENGKKIYQNRLKEGNNGVPYEKRASEKSANGYEKTIFHYYLKYRDSQVLMENKTNIYQWWTPQTRNIK